MQISYFKRGFGGFIFPLYRGIKYYNYEFMSRELENNYKQYLLLEQKSYESEKVENAINQ